MTRTVLRVIVVSLLCACVSHAQGKLQLRRYTTTAGANAYTPTNGEPVWDAQGKTLRVGDGTTAGGNLISGSSGTNGISDSAFAASWDADTTNGASRNALYDKIILLQTGSSNLTNWGALATSDKQDALGFVPQAGDADLTNWAAIAPSAKQDALGYVPQLGSANLTNWGALATSSKQDSFTTGAGVTNVADVLSANLVAGTSITLTTNANGQISIASTATGGGTSTSNNIPSSVTYSGTNIFIDAGAATLFRIMLTNSAYLHFPTNGSDGQLIRLAFTQDATGSRLLSLTNSVVLGVDIPLASLTTNANKTDWMSLIYWQASNRWDVVGLTRGY